MVKVGLQVEVKVMTMPPRVLIFIDEAQLCIAIMSRHLARRFLIAVIDMLDGTRVLQLAAVWIAIDPWRLIIEVLRFVWRLPLARA